MDKKAASEVILTLNRLVVAIDRELGITYTKTGQFR